MADMNINDEAVKFFRDNGYINSSNYNDGMLAWLRDYFGVTNSTLADLRARYIRENGTELQIPGATIVELLFSNGERGAWFSAADPSLLWTDTGKTTNVTDGDAIAVQDSVDVGTAVRHTREQSNASLRPIYRVRTDGIGYIDYSGGKTWSIPGSDSSMKYMHDGTGGAIISYIEKTTFPGVTSNIVGTADTSSNVGFELRISGTSGSMFHTIYRGVSGATASGSVPYAAISTPIRMYTASYINTDPAVTMYVDNSVDEETGAKLNEPSTADSTTEITWDATSGHIEYHTIFVDKVVTQTQSERIYASLKSTAEPVIPQVMDYGLILLGQSNQSGRGDFLVIRAEDKQEGVYMYSKAEEFRYATIPTHSMYNTVTRTIPGENQNTPAHGSSLRASKAINTATGNTMLLLPLGVGGTSIADWDVPGDINTPTTLYGFFNRQWNAVKNRVQTPVIIMNGHEATASSAGISWTNGGVGTQYQDEFTSFYNNLQSDITGTTNIPVIQVQLPTRDTQGAANIVGAGAEAQLQLESLFSNVYVIPSYDQPKGDGAHFTRAGYDVIADRIALAFREHILGESVNGTGPRFVSAAQITTTTVDVTFDKTVQTSVGDYSDLFRVHAGGVEQTITSATRTSPTVITITVSAAMSGSMTIAYGYVPVPNATTLTDIVRDTDDFPCPFFGPRVITAL